MTYIITGECIDIKDKSCIEECPVDCIYEGASMLYINPDECVDCGACEPVCPSSAIYYHEDLPEPRKIFIEINKDFFKEIGNPGGSKHSNFKHMDHPLIVEISEGKNA
jgi:ferredoxin